MKTKIINALNKLNISEYLIEEKNVSGIELFFIKKRLDTKRRKDVRHYRVTVYNDFTKNDTAMRGHSTINIYSTMTDSELEKSLSDAYMAAANVCNPVYKLPEGEAKPLITVESSLMHNSMEDNCRIMTEALFAEDTLDDVFLNSAELFLYETTCFITTSAGTDVSYKICSVKGEFVAQCKLPQDVETYQSFRYTDLNAEALRKKVQNALIMTKARSLAATAPAAGKYRIILSGQYMKTLMEYYTNRSCSSYIYAKYSSFEKGTQVQGENITGDKLTITLKAEHPYSDEGIPMTDRPLLKDGVLETIHGNLRFAYYLGIEPTGNYDNIQVAAGSMSFEEMKKQPYLHVVNFSDFQMDAFSGHFGGEIRLAFLYDGEKEIPVTGGSINGSIFDVHSSLKLSTELQVEDGYEGPFAVCLDDISVAGE